MSVDRPGAPPVGRATVCPRCRVRQPDNGGDRCAHCGACVVHCPTQALHLADPATRTIGFCEDNCVECLACIAACPFGACSSAF